MAHENCDSCNNDYDFSPQIALLHIFMGSEVNWLDVTCPHCGHHEVFFFSIRGALDLLNSRVVNCQVGDKPPADKATKWAEYMDVEPKNVNQPSMTSEKPGYILTPRLESVIAALHRLLETMPDKDLIEELELPAPKSSLPLHWTNGEGAPGAST